MGGQETIPVVHQASRDQVFAGLKLHFNGNRPSTELTVLELLRKAYPDFHITNTIPRRCDLHGYAKAGHAVATMDEDELYDATRRYKAPGPRLEGKPGILFNEVRFGRWTYVWKEHTFLLYEVEYKEFSGNPIKLYFVLYPRSEDTASKETVNPTDELLLSVGAWSTEVHEEIYVFDDGFWTKNHELWVSVQGSSWDEVILNPTMKANLIEDVQGFFDNRVLYKSLAVPWKRGLILHGVPGNGKTISIKALINAIAAREDPIPSLYVKSFDACGDRTSKFAIRSIFGHARIMAPCLLIFEDLDSLITKETRSYFLNEVDGLESNDGILMIGSTNHLESLDPAISRRPSRFDRKYHFKLPNEDERTAYCDFWRKKLANVGGGKLVDFDDGLSRVIAKLSDGFSFAYLKELFVVALLVIARGGNVDPEGVEEGEKNGDAKSSTDTEPVMVEHEPSRSTSAELPAIDAAEKAPVTVANPNTTTTATVQSEPSPLKEEPKKTTLPEVETPEHLRDNLLLKVIRVQLKMLLDEMDNTKEDEWPSSKTVGVSGANVNGVRMAMGMRGPMRTMRAVAMPRDD